MKKYTVKTGHRGKWWWIEIPEVDMGFSQAKTYRQVETMAREVISLLTNVPEDSFEVEIVMEGAEAELIKKVEALTAAARAAEDAAAREKRQAIKTLQESNIPVRDIAAMLHVSAGYISQLSKEAA